MSSLVAEYLVTDDLTILLGLIAATVFLLNNLYKPQPLVHPILLGRQSDVGRVRNPGESAVYRNYSTGLLGRFPLRPGKDVYILADFIKTEFEAARTLWSTRITNRGLQDRAAAFGTGLIRLAGLQQNESTVLLLLNDSVEFIISDLALANQSIVSHTLSSAKLLPYVLESHPPSAIIANAELLPDLLELIYETDKTGNHTIIVVGEPSSRARASVASNIKILNFGDVEREGVKTEKILSSASISPNDVFTVSFFETESGHVQGAQLTHENLTAGVAATRALLPQSHALSALDTVVSAHSLSTAYGRSIAYTALYEGASLATVASTKVYHGEEKDTEIDFADATSYRKYPIPSPTVLFLKPRHLTSVVAAIAKEASKSWILYPFARRHKQSTITEGHITKESLWDRLVFDGARTQVIGDGASTLRGAIISGGPLEASAMRPARVNLSVPLVNSYTHPLVPGPILASHALDVQEFPEESKHALAHVGPPSCNTEVKLIGLDDKSVEEGADPCGTLLIRGPSVGKILVNDSDYVSIPSEDEKEGWTSTGVKAKVQTNGAFQVLTPVSKA